MNLNWGFFYDSWLIDPLPKILNIFTEEEATAPDKNGERSKVSLNPSSLICYFGANPAYIYGEGKFLHEAFISPDGIAIIPEFNQYINSDIIDIDSVTVAPSKSTDFFNNSNEAKHFGYIDSDKYIKNIQKHIYKIDDNEYSTASTPSSDLRRANTKELSASATVLSNYQVYESTSEMVTDGIFVYNRLDSEGSSILDIIGSQAFTIQQLGAELLIRKGYQSFRDMKNAYGIRSLTGIMDRMNTVLMFKTLPFFRFGQLFSIGENTETSGFEFHINESSVTISIKNGIDETVITAPAIVDWGLEHSMYVGFYQGILSVIVDDYVIIREPMSHGLAAGDSILRYCAEKKYGYWTPSHAGNISELVISKNDIKDSAYDAFFTTGNPFIRSSSIPSVDVINMKPILPYNLTYTDDKSIFIPNYSNEPIYSLYRRESDGTLREFAKNDISVSENRYAFPNESRFEFLMIGDEIGREMKALTKLTSDTHYPLKVEVKFKIPKWYNKKNKYFFSLSMKPVRKFLHYQFKKFKDEY